MNITTDKEILKDLFIAECSDVYKSEIYIKPYTDYIRFIAYEPTPDCENGSYFNTKVIGEVEVDYGEKQFPCIEAAKNAILTIELADMAGCLNILI